MKKLRSEYQIVDYLKDVFSNVPILMLLAIITLIILEYIYKLLKLGPLT